MHLGVGGLGPGGKLSFNTKISNKRGGSLVEEKHAHGPKAKVTLLTSG